jgi:hypothetical protein
MRQRSQGEMLRQAQYDKTWGLLKRHPEFIEGYMSYSGELSQDRCFSITI